MSLFHLLYVVIRAKANADSPATTIRRTIAKNKIFKSIKGISFLKKRIKIIKKIISKKIAIEIKSSIKISEKKVIKITDQ